MEYTKPEIWDNWFLKVKNIHNFQRVSVEILKEENPFFMKDKDNWKIYLAVHHPNGGEFQTSNLVGFDETQLNITTNNGSVYKIGKSLNDYQLKYLKKYFS